MSNVTEIPLEHLGRHPNASTPPPSPFTRETRQVSADGAAPRNRPTVCFLNEYNVRLLEQAVAINGGMDTPIGWSVAEKMKHVELCGVIPADCVDLNSHVIFRVDDRSSFSRILVHWDEFFVPGLHLSLHTPWGITLLGMKTGSEAKVYWRAGRAETIKVELVTQKKSSTHEIHSRPKVGRMHRSSDRGWRECRGTTIMETK